MALLDIKFFFPEKKTIYENLISANELHSPGENPRMFGYIGCLMFPQANVTCYLLCYTCVAILSFIRRIPTSLLGPPSWRFFVPLVVCITLIHDTICAAWLIYFFLLLAMISLANSSRTPCLFSVNELISWSIKS